MRAVRLAALVVTAVVVQVAVFPHLRLFGTVPDLGLVLAVAVAYHAGPEPAAIAGFFAGFAFDLFLETPVGLSALSYSLTGYAVGVLQTGLLRSPRGLSPFFGAAGGLFGGGLFVAAGALADADVVLQGDTLRIVATAALYDALLAPFVFAAVRRALQARDRAAPLHLR